jgi:phytol kinase
MSLDFLKIFFVVFGLILFLVSIRLLGKKQNWEGELQRKILHVGLGSTALTFPWIFDENWQVFAVCLISTLVLVSIRNIPKLRNTLGKSIYDVDRSSLGELLFALSIALVFYLSDRNMVLYILPLAILTISDTVAALVGRHYGKSKFEVSGGVKSWEGTIAFAMITFAIFWVILYSLTEISWLSLTMISLTFAIVGAMIEAVSWHGLDNLFIPIGAFLFLDAFLHLEESHLILQLLILCAIVLLGLTAGPKSQLNTQALMTAIISAYFFGMVGGPSWLAAPVLVFLCHMLLAKLYSDERNYSVDAILSVTSGGFFWLLMDHLFHLPYSFFLFTLALAIHLQIIVLLRLKASRLKSARPWEVIMVSLGSGALLLAPALLYHGADQSLLFQIAFGLFIMIAGGIKLDAAIDRFSRKRWIVEACLALIGSAAGLIPFWIMEHLWTVK